MRSEISAWIELTNFSARVAAEIFNKAPEWILGIFFSDMKGTFPQTGWSLLPLTAVSILANAVLFFVWQKIRRASEADGIQIIKRYGKWCPFWITATALGTLLISVVRFLHY